MNLKNKNEFQIAKEEFLSESKKPIIMEVFTNPDDEKEAGRKILYENRNETSSEEIKSELKKSIKSIIGEKNVSKLKDILKK